MRLFSPGSDLTGEFRISFHAKLGVVEAGKLFLFRDRLLLSKPTDARTDEGFVMLACWPLGEVEVSVGPPLQPRRSGVRSESSLSTPTTSKWRH